MPAITPDTLKKILPSFSLCGDELLTGFARKCSLLKVSPRQTLVRIGSAEPPAFFVQSGVLGVWSEGRDFAPCLTGLVPAGHFWLGTFRPGGCASQEVRPVVPSKLIAAPLTEIFRLFVGSSAWALWLADELYQAISNHHLHRSCLTSAPLEQKLLTFWLTISEPQQDGSRVFKGRVSQQLIAQYLGVCRAEVNRKTLALEKAGLLERFPGQTVVRPDAQFLMTPAGKCSHPPFVAQDYVELVAQMA